MAESGERRTSQQGQSDEALQRVRLEDVGISEVESHRFQRAAEAKTFRDKAEALRAYAKQANNREAEVQFAEIKVRAEIRCGELLIAGDEDGTRKARGSNQHDGSDSVSLAQLGLDAKESERFQAAARAPRKAVEAVSLLFVLHDQGD